MYNDKVKYTLFGEGMKPLELKNDPINSLEPKRSFERNRDALSFITKYSDAYEFTKEGAVYIWDYYKRFAPSGSMVLRREERNPSTDILELDYESELEITSAVRDQKTATVKINIKTGSLADKIEAQMSEKFEFDRTEDVDGNRISDLTYKNFVTIGRTILNESYLFNKEDILIQDGFFAPVSLTFDVKSQSDVSVQGQLNFPDITGTTNFVGFTSGGDNIFFNEDQIFYKESDRDKKLNIKIEFKADALFGRSNGKKFDLFVARKLSYNSTEFQYDGKLSEAITVKRVTPPDGGREHTIVISETVSIDVLRGESLAIFCDWDKSSGGFDWKLSYDQENLKINISEDSVFPPTAFNCLTVDDGYSRLLEIITGDSKNYRSDYFTQGEFKHATIASGKMIRQLNKVDVNNNPTDIPETLSTSLKDLLSTKGYFATGYGIEKIGGKEIFVVEDLKHFFRDKEKIHFGRVSAVTESFAENYSWVSAEFGNNKAGEYEEQQGRFEYNAKNKYGFPTTTAKEVYDGVSKIRTDLLGVEQARRKNQSVAPTEDTPYDNELFLFDSNKFTRGSITNYALYLWRDLLASAPKKVYDPDSVGNFRLTPMRSLFRHMWLFGTSLYKFPEKLIKYNSTTGYAGMITQYPNKPERAENGSYTVGDFIYPKMDSTIVKFTTVLTYQMKKEIQGSYIENNREIPNLYGLAEYEDETGEKQYGWVLKVDIEGKLAKVEMIKSRR
ncbi:hypothetical protein ACJRPK_13820 [Aquimarina sp. 2-A2]|uniref:hypothetical protein n=1 Tax=Aquimarina sp. 2-A2 TaxID=3382644 RepID=UPI00387EF5B3